MTFRKINFGVLGPQLAPVSAWEHLRSSFGALVGVLLTGLIAALAFGPSDQLPLLIAPIGASAVLLFAVSTSPLAHPWSVIGGNMTAALIGVVCAMHIPDTLVAASLAVALSIAAMMALRCLHPPSGAVALTAVLGGPSIDALGLWFVIWPVGFNSLLIVVIALLFNNLTGRKYPHQPAASHATDRKTKDAPPMGRLGVTTEDVAAVLREHDQIVPVAPADLETMLQEAEMRAFERRSAGLVCGAIMSRDVATVAVATPLTEALALLRRHRIKALPVVDEEHRVVGILTQTDLVDKADWAPFPNVYGFGQRLRSFVRPGRVLTGRAGDIMSSPVRSTSPRVPLGRLIPMMTDAGHHHLPVIEDDGKLAGIITQSDVIAALFAAEAADIPLSA